MMLSEKLKIYENNFPIDLDRKNIKLFSSGTCPAQIDKLLKMSLAPSGGLGETVKVRHIVKQTIRNDFPIFDLGQITASLRSALSWDPY